jgi:hypothetical protein
MFVGGELPLRFTLDNIQRPQHITAALAPFDRQENLAISHYGRCGSASAGRLRPA